VSGTWAILRAVPDYGSDRSAPASIHQEAVQELGVTHLKSLIAPAIVVDDSHARREKTVGTRAGQLVDGQVYCMEVTVSGE
jgi:hypothetical protein